MRMSLMWYEASSNSIQFLMGRKSLAKCQDNNEQSSVRELHLMTHDMRPCQNSVSSQLSESPGIVFGGAAPSFCRVCFLPLHFMCVLCAAATDAVSFQTMMILQMHQLIYCSKEA